MVLGVLGGAWLMRPQPGKQRLTARITRVRQAREPTRVAEPQARPLIAPAAPVAPEPTAGAPAPAVAPPATAQQPAAQQPATVQRAAPTQPASPPGAASPTSREEEAAEAQYKIAVNMLRRQQIAQGRQALQELLQRYPRTRFAADARDLLKQIPEPVQPRPVQPPLTQPPTAVARSRTPATPPPGRPEPVPAPTLRERFEQERPSAKPSATATEEVAGSRGSPTGARRPPASLPPSLQNAQSSAAQSAAATAQNDVRVISAVPEQGQVVLNLEYHLATQRPRPVFVGAWVQSGAVSRYFGYSSSPIAPGRGQTRVILPGAPADLSNLRIAFFEEGGQRFFIKDVTIPK